ncbi:sphinganine C4-monooxygenase 2-like, partial [Phalaenopsis equestris]|uniref:sphinganine C4-monooxygenase 2-like n=1 Tax=Phalaenopsis equestris TaxID=78828 RepID=UPI0009E3CA0C
MVALFLRAASIKFDQTRNDTYNNFTVSDELLGTLVPIAVYWIYSGIYILLGDMNQYRLHTKAEEDNKNVVSKRTVSRGVLVQQAFQIAVVFLVLTFMSGADRNAELPQPSVPVIILQFIVAMVVMDTWQYFTHRFMHFNKYLHIHLKHHTL